jgi:hypothetical protein
MATIGIRAEFRAMRLRYLLVMKKLTSLPDYYVSTTSALTFRDLYQNIF